MNLTEHVKPMLIMIFSVYRPDTQSYIDKIKKDEREKAKGAQADNRSFFSKYVSILSSQNLISKFKYCDQFKFSIVNTGHLFCCKP